MPPRINMSYSKTMEILDYGSFIAETFRGDIKVEFDGTCADIDIDEWERRMKGRRKFSYERMKKIIKSQYPEMYDELALDLYNPWHNDTYRTPGWLVLTHSATEYFFRISVW